jgi:hypothetical protein
VLQEISQANGHPHSRPRPDEFARAELARITSIIASTPIEPRVGLVAALKFCAAEIEEMLEAGVIDRPEGNDAIWDGLVQAGAVEKIGADAAHQMMAEAFRRRECEKSEEQSSEGGSGALFAARCLADVDPTPIRWLWKDRFARGKINLVGGSRASENRRSLAHLLRRSPLEASGLTASAPRWDLWSLSAARMMPPTRLGHDSRRLVLILARYTCSIGLSSATRKENRNGAILM